MSHDPGCLRALTGARPGLLLPLLLVSGPLVAQPAAGPVAQPASAAATASSRPVDKPAAPRRHRVLIMDLKAVGVDASLVTVLGGLITDAVARYPSIQTISTADIRSLVELETGKQQVGCDTTSCLAEVAGAMGAEYVVFGNVGMLGTTTVVQLSLFDAAQAQAVARRSIKASTHDALATAVEPAVADLLRDLIPEEQRRAVTAVTTTTAPTTAAAASGNDLGWMLWTGGVLSVVSGTMLAATYFGGLAIASAMNAPPEVLEANAIPVVGPVMIAEQVRKDLDPDNQDGGTPEFVVPMLYGSGGLQALLGAGTLCGLGVFSLGKSLDGEGLTWLGHLWQWGLLGLGGGLAAGGLAFDLAWDASHDHEVGPTDFVGPGLYLLAAVVGGSALFLNPFGAEAE